MAFCHSNQVKRGTSTFGMWYFNIHKYPSSLLFAEICVYHEIFKGLMYSVVEKIAVSLRAYKFRG